MSIEHPVDVLNTVNLVTQCLCIPIVTLFVCFRFYTRIRFKQSLGVEDCKLTHGSLRPQLLHYMLTPPDGCLIAWVCYSRSLFTSVYSVLPILIRRSSCSWDTVESVSSVRTLTILPHPTTH